MCVPTIFHSPLRNASLVQSHYQTEGEIADSYRQQLKAQQPGRELPAPHYTAREIAQIETYAAKQTDVQLRAQYDELVRAAIAEGRVGYAAPRPEQKLGAGQTQDSVNSPEHDHSIGERKMAGVQKETFDAAALTSKSLDRNDYANKGGHNIGMSF